MGMKYPKFHKMDDMSKLGLVANEFLLSDINFEQWNDDATGIFLQTENGCLTTDIEHQETISKNAVSPAVFVYTLPSIVIGEITIKNKWFGESALFVDECSKLTNLVAYCRGMFHDNKVEKAIVGFIDAYNNNYIAKFAVVEKFKETPEIELETLTELFN